jgi:hypothetical protein
MLVRTHTHAHAAQKRAGHSPLAAQRETLKKQLEQPGLAPAVRASLEKEFRAVQTKMAKGGKVLPTKRDKLQKLLAEPDLDQAERASLEKEFGAVQTKISARGKVLPWFGLGRLLSQLPAHHCSALHCTALHSLSHVASQSRNHTASPHRLHCTALRCTALHCTALHCTALHCTELHHIAATLHSGCTAMPPLQRLDFLLLTAVVGSQGAQQGCDDESGGCIEGGGWHARERLLELDRRAQRECGGQAGTCRARQESQEGPADLIAMR